MKEQRIKELRNLLKYLIDFEIDKEIELNFSKLEDKNVDINKLACDIYLQRGLNINKIKKTNKTLVERINDMIELFKIKDKNTKKKMFVDIIYIMLVIILVKIPFDLIRDIGYEYVEIISTKTLYNNIWNLIFLIMYTITIISIFIAFLNNFNNKYKNTK